jgi:5-oxoprolinase (ATP-hydrolysing)
MEHSFAIDVGGTFTDVVARRPDGTLVTHKLLSTGAARGTAGPGSRSDLIVDPTRAGEPVSLWEGYDVHLLDARSSASATTVPRVTRFDTESGALHLDPPIEAIRSGVAYELKGGEDAPVVAIRFLMGLRRDEPIGPVTVRLGTTRATNALLERKGARTAFITTKGLGDILRIGHQDRPELFSLNVRKRHELYGTVVETDERLAADGTVLRSPDLAAVRRQLQRLRDDGIEAVAICLLHAHVNPIHEDLVAEIAADVGFTDISVSSQIARMEGIVSRGDTTVVDAYLSTVIRDYVRSLRRSMPQARIQLMTSSGGLIDAEHACGKDTILSGPAGGVVGCAHVARRAGFDRAIGFDMGGTSTDVCRIDPPPRGLEYQHETVKAGVRIKTPMLAVETVAAGGGSICGFDGQKLVVGPESAGADPGPACYGRGGPLTVTDVNVFLGRVVPGFFPFPLDCTAVDSRIQTMCEQVNAATGSVLTPVELAEGFVRIANANMAAAVKRVSLAKGYDAREYALVTFGGAGAQHACAIAETLGISRIVCSPFAGVLSAVGIGASDVKRIDQQSIRVTLDDTAEEPLRAVCESLESKLRDAMLDEGVDPARLRPPLSTLDLCYAGQGTSIPVPADPFDGIRSAFEAAHRRLYGYTHEDRAIEVRAARVELSAASDTVPIDAEPGLTPPAAEPRRTTMICNAAPRRVLLHVRNELAAGQQIPGPAIIIEDTSTVVVDEGWRAYVAPGGDLLLQSARQTEPRQVWSEWAPRERRADELTPRGPDVPEAVSAEADPIRLELFNNQFAAVAEQMGEVLRRTAISTNVKERLDYSCAVFTPEGDLVANAPHIPVHLGAMSDCVKALMRDVERFTAGDVYITNDPYRGGSHLNDVTVVTPIIGDVPRDPNRDRYEADRAEGTKGRRDEGTKEPDQRQPIHFFVASRAHHAEIGGKSPGSMPPDSTNLAEEGVVIRAFNWMQDGRPQEAGLRAILTAPPFPSRAPDENISDIAAQVAANQTGVRELHAMVARYGLDVVHGYMHHIQAAAERKMRSALARLPHGTHHFEDRMDDGTAIRLALTITGDRAVFDFTGTGPVTRGNLNANRAIVSSALIYCLRCLIDEDIPLNAGILAPIDLILPDCFLNPPPHADPAECPAVAGGNVETSQRLVDVVFGALQSVAASQGTMNNLSLGNERFGYYETICGGSGAGPGFDGADAVHTHMTNTRLTDPEVLESRYPLRLVRFAIRTGSGGNGKHNGGCGVIREIEFLEPLQVSILSQRRTTAPYGLAGGSAGQPGRNTLHRAGQPEPIDLGPVAQIHANPGDRLTIETPGAGGYG